MLSAEAIKHIEATHAVANGISVDTHVPAIILPEGYKLEDIEHLQEHRSRLRGSYATGSLPDFCDFVIENEYAASQGFIDIDWMACNVIFNIGCHDYPGHCDHKAILKLKPTALFGAIVHLADQQHSQKALAEWMEDWHDKITVIGVDGDQIPIGVAVQKIRTITTRAKAETTSTENSFSAGRSAMEEIEAAHEHQQPAELQITLNPYEGLPEITITLRLSIITGEKPMIKPRWVQREAQKEQIGQNFKAVLTEQIGQVCALTLGTYAP